MFYLTLLNKGNFELRLSKALKSAGKSSGGAGVKYNSCDIFTKSRERTTSMCCNCTFKRNNLAIIM
jgi:hypothetical protein